MVDMKFIIPVDSQAPPPNLENQAVKLHAGVTMTCRGSEIQTCIWRHVAPEESSVIIFNGVNISRTFQDNMSIKVTADMCELFIMSVTLDLAGVYECDLTVNSMVEKYRAELIVIGTYAIQLSNIYFFIYSNNSSKHLTII